MEIDIGDVVKVKGLFNPPEMLVIDAKRPYNDKITCVWYSLNETIQEQTFPKEVLIKIK